MEDLAAGPPQPRQPQQRPDRERLRRCAGGAAGRARYYFGEYYAKPTIGDPLRPIEPEDILRANRMMYVASAFALAWGVAIRAIL